MAMAESNACSSAIIRRFLGFLYMTNLGRICSKKQFANFDEVIKTLHDTSNIVENFEIFLFSRFPKLPIVFV